MTLEHHHSHLSYTLAWLVRVVIKPGLSCGPGTKQAVKKMLELFDRSSLYLGQFYNDLLQPNLL